MSTALEVREHNTLEAAVAAYERGDHAEALRVFRHLADDGDMTAHSTWVACTLAERPLSKTTRKRRFGTEGPRSRDATKPSTTSA